jgi:hypothetical protein
VGHRLTGMRPAVCRQKLESRLESVLDRAFARRNRPPAGAAQYARFGPKRWLVGSLITAP